MQTSELDVITYYRNFIARGIRPGDLVSLADVDEHKLPFLDWLLKKIIELRLELDLEGLILKTDKQDQYPKANLYELTDIGYVKESEFRIRIKSDWLNPACRHSLDKGFNFQLAVEQKSKDKQQIADRIKIQICRLNTSPMAFASAREYFKFSDSESSFFCNLLMNGESKIIDNRLNFKAAAFKEAVEDACEVMGKIISRKNNLRILKRKC